MNDLTGQDYLLFMNSKVGASCSSTDLSSAWAVLLDFNLLAKALPFAVDASSKVGRVSVQLTTRMRSAVNMGRVLRCRCCSRRCG